LRTKLKGRDGNRGRRVGPLTGGSHLGRDCGPFRPNVMAHFGPGNLPIKGEPTAFPPCRPLPFPSNERTHAGQERERAVMSSAAQQQRAAAEQQEEVEHGPFPIEQLQVWTTRPPRRNLPASSPTPRPNGDDVSGFSWGFRFRMTGNGGRVPSRPRVIRVRRWVLGRGIGGSWIFCSPLVVESRPTFSSVSGRGVAAAS
jgi:hypothetical protein